MSEAGAASVAVTGGAVSAPRPACSESRAVGRIAGQSIICATVEEAGPVQRPLGHTAPQSSNGRTTGSEPELVLISPGIQHGSRRAGGRSPRFAARRRLPSSARRPGAGTSTTGSSTSSYSAQRARHGGVHLVETVMGGLGISTSESPARSPSRRRRAPAALQHQAVGVGELARSAAASARAVRVSCSLSGPRAAGFVQEHRNWHTTRHPALVWPSRRRGPAALRRIGRSLPAWSKQSGPAVSQSLVPGRSRRGARGDDRITVAEEARPERQRRGVRLSARDPAQPEAPWRPPRARLVHGHLFRRRCARVLGPQRRLLGVSPAARERQALHPGPIRIWV
jgi:hypothetical protein